MSFSGCEPTISAGRRRAVGERELDRGGAVDDVEAGEDVAVEVDDDAAAEAVVLVLVRACSVLDALGLDEDERGLDGLVDDLGVGRRRRHARRGRWRWPRRPGAGSAVRRRRGQEAVQRGPRPRATAAPMPNGARRREARGVAAAWVAASRSLEVLGPSAIRRGLAQERLPTRRRRTARRVHGPDSRSAHNQSTRVCRSARIA